MERPGGQIGSYRIDRELSPGRTFLGRDEDGRQVVLKRLEADCLLHGQLHISIRERLARVRELAHGRVGQLCGVERMEGAGVFLVWRYVPGETFEQWMAAGNRPGDRVAAIGREIALALEALHRLGIVHGAVHGRNILVVDGRAMLIDISPLLYNDPAEDAAGLEAMLRPVLGAELAERLEGRTVTRMAAIMGGSRVERAEDELDAGERRIKRRAWLGAAGALAAGVCVAAAIWWMNRVGGPTDGMGP